MYIRSVKEHLSISPTPVGLLWYTVARKESESSHKKPSLSQLEQMQRYMPDLWDRILYIIQYSIKHVQKSQTYTAATAPKMSQARIVHENLDYCWDSVVKRYR